MKICIMSDTHLSSQKYGKMDKNKNINRFLTKQFETMEWIMDYLKENNIDTIIHGGDMFDSPRMSAYPISRTRELFDGFDAYVIKGNHDDSNFLHDEGISAIDLIGVNAINEPMSKIIDDVNFVFIPWGYEIDESFLLDDKKNVLVAHGFPKDFINDKFNDSPNNQGGVLSNKTRLFDLVITGHYHKVFEFSIKDTVYLNPGSISGSGNDSNFDPSIWILDTKDLSYERVKIPNAIKLIDVTPEDATSYLDSIEDENVYRIRVKDIPDRKLVNKAKKNALEIQFRVLDDGIFNIKEERVDEFWKYVESNKPNYVNDFKNALASLER